MISQDFVELGTAIRETPLLKEMAWCNAQAEIFISISCGSNPALKIEGYNRVGVPIHIL